MVAEIVAQQPIVDKLLYGSRKFLMVRYCAPVYRVHHVITREHNVSPLL